MNFFLCKQDILLEYQFLPPEFPNELVNGRNNSTSNGFIGKELSFNINSFEEYNISHYMKFHQIRSYY